MPHIQIEDMGGVTNLTQSVGHIHDHNRTMKSGHNSETNSVAGILKGTGDFSRLGHQTRTTEHTSHIGMNNTAVDGGIPVDRTTSGHGGGFSFLGGPGSVANTVHGTTSENNILNYPYSYD